MTNPAPLSVEEVLGMLLDEFETPSRRAIAEFSRRYPEHRAALLEFAVAWAEDEHLPEGPSLTTEEEARVASRAQSFLQNLLFEREAAIEPLVAAPATQPVRTLAQLAKEAGMTPHDAARAVGLDLDLMGELNRRGILAETIPRWLARAFATLFSVAVERILASWSSAPSREPVTAFLAKTKPQAVAQRSFQDAVRSSANLTDDQKALLLRDDD